MGVDHAVRKELERLIREAGRLAVETRSAMCREIKPDGSIVTTADRNVETFLRHELASLTPGASFWGEEFGYEPPAPGGFWVLDPIDGTSNFAYGQPLWGVTAGYLVDGKIVLGAIDLPELGWTLTATKGGGATLNGAPLPEIPAGPIAATDLLGIGDSAMAVVPNFPGKMRHIGSFVIEAAFVARQNLRAMATARVKLYDAAAGILICRELGAEVREISGADWNEAEWQQPIPCRPLYVGPKGSNFPFGER